MAPISWPVGWQDPQQPMPFWLLFSLFGLLTKYSSVHFFEIAAYYSFFYYSASLLFIPVLFYFIADFNGSIIPSYN